MTNLWSKWLKQLRNPSRGARIRPQKPQSRKDSRSRLAIESLEDRTVPATITFVNDNWHLFFDADSSGTLTVNDVVTNANDSGPQFAATYGVDAFGTVTTAAPGISVPSSVPGFDSINSAIANTTVGGTVNVLAGNYSEAVLVNKSLTLQNDGNGPATIQGVASANDAVITVTASNVTVQGLNVDVNRPTVSRGIYARTTFNNLVLANNTITSFGAGGSNSSRGILASDTLSTETVTLRGNTVTGDAGTNSAFLRAVELYQVRNATVGGATAAEGNSFFGTGADLHLNFMGAGGTSNVQNNTFTGGGLNVTEPNAAATVNVVNNQFLPTSPLFTQSLFINHNYTTATINVSGNTFTGHTVGAFIVASRNVSLTDNSFTPAAGATDFRHIVADTQMRNGVQYGPFVPVSFTLQGNTLNGSTVAGGTGLALYNGNIAAAGYGTVTLGGAGALANTFGANLDNFIALETDANPTFTPPLTGSPVSGPVTKNLDASLNNFAVAGASSGILPSAMSLSQLSELEDKIFHKIDNGTLGLVTVLSNTIFVTPAATPTATNNDYTRIKNALEAAPSGSTIQLHGVFDWSETNAAASWALGNDGIASTADDYSILVPANVNGITLTAASLGDATIQGPGDLASVNLEGFLVFDGGDNKNWTISNLEIFDFDLGIGMFFGTGGSDAFNGTKILNNHIRVPVDLNPTEAPADVNQNIGIHYSFGINQTIQGNIIDIDGSGLSDGLNQSSSVGMQSNTSGGSVYNGLLIDGNTINVTGVQSAQPPRILGIWENGHAHTSNITVSNNTFNNLTTGGSAATNLMRGFRLTSHSGTATTVTYSGNAVNGANIGFEWITGANFSSNKPIVVQDNTMTGVETGFLIQSNGQAAFTGKNSVTGTATGTGLEILAGSKASVVGASFTGTGVGIDVDGGTARIQDTDLSGNSIAGLRVKNGALVDAGDGSASNFTGLGSSAGNNDLTGYTGVTLAIDNQNLDAGPAPDVKAQNNNFGTNLASLVELVVRHTVDDSSLTLVDFSAFVTQPVPSTVYVDDNWTGTTLGADPDGAGPATAFGYDAFSVIQDGVDGVATGGTVNVLEGTYAEAVLVNKTVALLGAQAGVDARGRSAAESIITPAAHETTALIYITAPDVTVDGFTIDGAGSFSGGELLLDGSTTSNAARGIAVDGDNALVRNNRISDTYRRGLQFGIASAPIGGLASQNEFNLIGADVATSANSGDAILAFSDASAIDNTITNARNGITFVQVYSPNVAPIVVSGNDISAREVGIAFNEMSSSLPVITLTNNTVATGDNGTGLLLWSIGTPNGLSTSGNTFTGTGVGGTGVYAWVGTPSVPMDITLTGESISGYATGVLLTNEDTSYGVAPESASLTLSGVSISLPAGGVGIQILDTAAGDKAVTVTLDGTNTIEAGSGAVGVLIDGPLASLGGDTLGTTQFVSFASGSPFVVLANAAYGGPLEIDGTAANYSGVAGGSSLSTDDAYALSDQISDFLDSGVAGSNTVGFVRLKDGFVFVTPSGGSIQRGIDAASDGDTVSVAGGSYTGGADATTGGKSLTLAAGSTTALVTIAGDVMVGNDDTVEVSFNGSTPGADFDQVVVNGTVTLNGALGAATATRTAVGGEVLVLIKNDGTDPVVGTFQGLPEGSVFELNGVSYRISYTYNAEAGTVGDGNDVALTDLTVPTVTLSMTGDPLAEAGGVATITATLSNPSATPVTVNLGFSGTASGSDYTASGVSIVIPAGSLTGSITLTGVDDTIFEGDETVAVDVTSVTGGTESGTQQVVATITDDDSAPEVTLSVSGDPLAENGGVATITATLSNPSATPVTVNLGFTGTALGSDYTASGVSIVIPAGSLTGSITLTGVDDTIFEGDETVAVDVTSVTGGTESGTQQVTATITDDDSAPEVTLSVTGDPLAENGGVATITATLSNPSATAVTVNLGFTGTASGSDYTASGVSIVIPAGSLTGSITLTGVDDTIFEGDETVAVDVTSVTGGTESGTQQVVATITDDDSAPEVTLSLSGDPLAENGGVATITATLSNPSATPVTVNLGFSGTALGSDYTASGVSIVIPAGSLTGSITLTGVDDTIFEGDETVAVDVTSVAGGTESGTQQVTATITDDDSAPEVTLSLSGDPLAENGGVATITATLSNPSATAVTVNLGFSGTALGSDYTASGVSIVIPAGSLTGSITLTGVDDTIFEGDETVIVDVTSVTGGTESGTQQVVATITDDDSAPEVTLSLTGDPLAENGGVATITATLSNPSATAVTVNLGFTGTALGSDYTASGVSIVIPAGSLTGSITLTGVDDAIFEGDETVVVDVTSVTGGTESGTQQVVATITDDDSAPEVTLSVSGSPLVEAGGVATITATLSNPSATPVTVNLGFSGTALGSDYSASGVSIVIPAGSLTGSITLTGVDDTIFEGDETVAVDVTSVAGGTESGTQQVTATITDDDSAPEVTLSVSGDPLAEAGGVATITATLSNPSATPVTVNLGFTGTASGSDYTASGVSIVIPAGSLTGSITLTGVDDTIFEGDETVIVDVTSVTGGTESGTQQVVATITDDDSAPEVTLALSGDPLAENGGVATITATLSNPSATAVTVNLGFTGTALGSDYTASGVSIVIPAGSLTGSITLTGVDDTIFEGDETVAVDVTSVTGGTESGTQQVVATITDDDSAPEVTLSLSGDPLAENGGVATITATLSNPSATPVTVNLGFTGTASGSDYTASGVSIVIPAGSLTGSITLTGVDDTIFEGDETVIVDVTSVTGGTESGTQQVVATITDDDSAPEVTLSMTGSPLAENGGVATITATLSNPSAAAVTVNLGFTGTASGSDYTASGVSIVIPAGSLTGSITLTSVDDITDESNETVIVDVTNVTGGTESGTQRVTATIIDDDLQFAVAGTVGGQTTVQVYQSNGTPAYSIPAGAGDLRIAVGDVTGDGIADLVIGSGIGSEALVRVISGATKQEVARFSPFETFDGGVFVTLGDLTHDGVADIIVTPDRGGGPRVSVYRGGDFQRVANFFGIDDPAFRGGARAAVGDMNGDGIPDLAVAAGIDGGPRVAVYDGSVLSDFPTHLVNDFFVFEQTLRNGVYLAIGDLNGDGFGDLFFGGGPGGGPRVMAISGQTLLSVGSEAAIAAPLANFFAGAIENRDGIRVAVKDLNNDGHVDLITGSGTGTQVTAYNGLDLSELFTLSSGSDEAGALNGVFVG